MKRRPLGASRAAAVLGLSPWTSPWDVWAELTDRAPADVQSAAALLGTRLEAPILDSFERFHGVRLDRSFADREGLGLDIYTDTPDGRAPWLSAHPDAIYRSHEGRWVVVDAKSTRDPVWSALPEHYRVQAVVQAAAARANGYDVSHAVMAVYHHEAGIDRAYRVETPPDLCNRVLATLEAWWVRHVLNDEQPEITTPPRYSVGAVLPSDPAAPWLDPDDTLRALASDWHAATAAKKQATAAYDLARARLSAAIGEAPGIAGLVAYPSDKRGRRSLRSLIDTQYNED